MEFLKLLTPLVGVILGVWLAPFIEKRKSNAEAQHILESFFVEIEDIKEQTERSIHFLDDLYKKTTLLKWSKISDDEDFFPIKFPRKIEFLTYDLVLKNSLKITTLDLRKAFRAINTIAQTLNKKIDNFPISQDKQDYDQKEIEELARQLAIFYYLVSRLSLEEERFCYFSETDEEVVEKVFSSLKTTFREMDVLGCKQQGA